MRKISTFLVIFLMISFAALAQSDGSVKTTSYGFVGEPIVVPSLAKQIANGTFIGISPDEPIKPGHPKMRGANNTVPGKGLPTGMDALVQNQKQAVNKSGKEPLLVFEADVSQAGVSDPTGAVGPNHFIGAWNFAFRIFDKEGNPLTNEASLATIFPGNSIGDPIVIYDAEADRFVITEFDSSPNGFNVAVCQGPDPVNDDWYVYTTGFGTGTFPDYTKFSVWPDGYYVTANISNNNRIFVVEREEMLQGNDAQFVALPLPGISTSGFYSPQFFHVSNNDLPAAGNATVVYLQDDAWGGVSEDHLKLWTVNVDWDNISNSSVSAATQIVTTPFISVFDGGSFSNRPQPSGPDVDVLQATVMNQAQFRKFPTHNSAVFNFVVDTDGSGGELAGIRWYELRQSDDGEPWEIYQEGTYISPNNNKDAFSGSMCMDVQGNIGMGYTTVSSTENIAIHYTGRYANDPLGQMTIDETLIAQSTSNCPGNRLADYVHLTVDPENDKTFWHIAEYFAPNRRDVVGAFQIAPNYVDDIGIASIDEPNSGNLTATEEIVITVFNGGEAEQTDFSVHYQVDDGAIVTQTFSGTLSAQGYESFTFGQTVDMSILGNTYAIKAFTSLDGDEDINNDTIFKSVKYIGPYDLGVSSIDAPTTGDLSSDEEIVVTVENFGTQTRSNFDVSYVFEDNTVTEVVPGPIAFGEQLAYSFTETGNFSDPGLHVVKSYTSHPGDADLNNDTTIRIVMNSDCVPGSSCGGGHAFELFQLGDINNESGCSENGYGDYLNMSTDLHMYSSNDLIVTTGYGDQFVKVWIDFNDNFMFDADEVVVDNYEIADGEAAGSYTETIPFNLPDALLGEHLMRAKISWIVPMGDDDACDDIANGGETEDYMVNILQAVGAPVLPLQNAEMIVADLGNNQFRVSMNTNETTDLLRIDLHNTMGQCLVYNRVRNVNGTYTYDIDMSYAKPGIYIVRLGTDEYGKVKRIIVK